MLNVESTLENAYPNFYTKYPKFITSKWTSLFQGLLREEEINSFLKDNKKKSIPFVESVLDAYNVSYEAKNSELENIPAIGRCVIIANHPLGGMDSLILLKMISDARADKKVKIVANEMLMAIKPVRDLLIPVNNMDAKMTKNSRKKIVEALENEEAVIFFPAAEVSRASIKGIKDEKWKSGFIKVARATKSPILPIFLEAKNSMTFYLASSIYKPIGTLMLPREMLKPKRRTIKANIGELIPLEAFEKKMFDLKEYTKLFKKHLYRLSKHKKPIFITQKSIAHPEDRAILKQELKLSQSLGMTSDGKKIYLVNFSQSPTIMAEIGRLREFTFRKVGEGTGMKRDTDSFDIYYKHLVLWDEEDLEIVGAYRIGEAHDIISRYGYKGLYMNSMCTLTDAFKAVSEDAIELGRSFVQPKYWGSRALNYLWQGIGAYVRAYPNIRYLYGAVSISGTYPQDAKDALVYFFTKYFSPKEKYFDSPITYVIPHSNLMEFKELFNGENYKEDFKTLKSYLNNFDVSVPTLYKQYSELSDENGVSFSDFAVDEDFGHCVDGYLMVDIKKMKPKKYQTYFVDSGQV